MGRAASSPGRWAMNGQQGEGGRGGLREFGGEGAIGANWEGGGPILNLPLLYRPITGADQLLEVTSDVSRHLPDIG